ncbi:hypothetical protein LF824_02560 [Citrobacter freundii]|uniref:hypothetical protein n=1 Tax=Citrobacter freundii TaxID=546 RepID=UPI0019006A02|nr:hypothetical protein [Citrobacter freundii]EFU7707241.1 hypothetical protein [Escherichia coli]ELR6030230.1 hypothetical protein [Citrobacter freundii]MBJ9155901.1 hypothetical protein [Citrobacter freundii]MCO5618590.1 hypothetical protein [Citrobacter freundii]MCO5627965.1 hypothetical protein [Citrobacter freundii]
MSNHTVQCPFCFKESPHGVKICTGCHAKVVYGECPVTVAILFGIAVMLLAYFAGSWTENFIVSVIVFFGSIFILKYQLKKVYADRILFIQRD